MKIAIIGQQDFGKAVLDAFLARGDEVAGVFCAPEKPGAKADPLRADRAGPASTGGIAVNGAFATAVGNSGRGSSAYSSPTISASVAVSHTMTVSVTSASIQR